MPQLDRTPQLNAALPIVLKDGSMAPAMRDFMAAVYRTFEIRGSGSPEGVIAAPLEASAVALCA